MTWTQDRNACDPKARSSHADYKALTNATLLVTQIRLRWTQGEWLEAEIGEEVCGSKG